MRGGGNMKLIKEIRLFKRLADNLTNGEYKKEMMKRFKFAPTADMTDEEKRELQKEALIYELDQDEIV